MIVSFAVSVIAIKFLMKYIKNHDFKAFGYYRIVLGIIVFLFFGIQAYSNNMHIIAFLYCSQCIVNSKILYLCKK